MNRSESIAKISSALLKAQLTMGNASKGASNPFFKSSYADLNSIREAVTPALNANGITVLQPTTTQDGRYFVETLLLHESGEYLSSLTEVIVSKQNDPQAAGSAISYARRYGLQSFLSVGAVDDDGETAMGRNSKPAYSAPAKAVATIASSTVMVEAAKETIDAAAKLAASVGTTVAAPAKRSPFKKPTAAAVAAPAATSNGSGAGGWS